MEIRTTVVQCEYCKRIFIIPSEKWEQGTEFNCICNNWNGTVKIGRFKTIKEFTK